MGSNYGLEEDLGWYSPRISYISLIHIKIKTQKRYSNSILSNKWIKWNHQIKENNCKSTL